MPLHPKTGTSLIPLFSVGLLFVSFFLSLFCSFFLFLYFCPCPLFCSCALCSMLHILFLTLISLHVSCSFPLILSIRHTHTHTHTHTHLVSETHRWTDGRSLLFVQWCRGHRDGVIVCWWHRGVLRALQSHMTQATHTHTCVCTETDIHTDR